ncbi:MAG: ISL3 family transposase, partial [Ktedonobacterales bacterium]|nr:ISL3 family transposase [Ktedonobacterales bacterium]
NRVLRTIGLATCGRLGARLAARLGILTSWRTIIRRILGEPTPSLTPVTHVGIDDFAFRRGHRYGSVVVDLDQRIILDLLAERTVERAAEWLRVHPEIVLVSRDRGGAYAAAAQQVLPQAQQVADCFHLVKNLLEAIEPVVIRGWTTLPSPDTILVREAPSHLSPLPSAPAAPVPPVEWPRRGRPRTAVAQAHYAAKLNQFAQVMALAEQQISVKAIAATLGLPPRTVNRWLQNGHSPGSVPRRRYPSILDPFLPYLHQRWHQGCQEGTILWREIQAYGYTGSRQNVYRYLAALHQVAPRAPHVPPSFATELPALGFDFLEEYSARDARWWFIRSPQRLSHRIRQAVEALCEVSPLLREVYGLVQSFGEMVRTRQGEQLDTWLAEVDRCAIPELRRFAQGIRTDYAAVRAGLTEVYSNDYVAYCTSSLE